MIGQSKRIGKMCEYHQIIDEIDRAHTRLQEQAGKFVALVEETLPVGVNEWWTYLGEEGEGLSQESLVERVAIGVEDPAEFVFRSVKEIQNRIGRVKLAVKYISRKERSIRSHSKSVLRKREDYKAALLKEDQIWRKGKWEWYEVVREIRGTAWEEEIGPYVQIDQLQAALLDTSDNEVGFSENAEPSIGKRALKHLVVENQTLDGESGTAQVQAHQDYDKEEKTREDAVWALYLSMVDGARVPGGVLEKGDDLPKGRSEIVGERVEGGHILRG